MSDWLMRTSTPVLIKLQALPKYVVPLLMASLMGLGLFFSSWIGFAALITVGVFLGWLVALSWRLLSAGARLMRSGVVVLVLLAAASKLLA